MSTLKWCQVFFFQIRKNVDTATTLHYAASILKVVRQKDDQYSTHLTSIGQWNLFNNIALNLIFSSFCSMRIQTFPNHSCALLSPLSVSNQKQKDRLTFDKESHYSPRYSSLLLDPFLPRLQLVWEYALPCLGPHTAHLELTQPIPNLVQTYT